MFPLLSRFIFPCFLVFVAALGIEKPGFIHPVQWVDLIYLVMIAAIIMSTPLPTLVGILRHSNTSPVIYLGLLSVSILVSDHIYSSMYKIAQIGYLISIPIIAQYIVNSRRRMMSALCAWMVGTSVAVTAGLTGLVGFIFSPDGFLYRSVRFHFGTLPPGHYPRISSTFFNANMFCAYLTASLGICFALAIVEPRYRRLCMALAVATVVISLFTISPGLGGIALLVGLLIWVTPVVRSPLISRLALFAGCTAALLFVLAASVTPIVHPTAPFLIHVPWLNATLAPAGRFLTWSAAWQEFSEHPWLGHGIGVDAVYVKYMSPSGDLQELTDAHNMYLNVAAQAGIVGIAGLATIIAAVASIAKRFHRASAVGLAGIVLCIAFLDAFAYQGLAGSYEDARFLWVLLGLIFAFDTLASDEREHMPTSLI